MLDLRTHANQTRAMSAIGQETIATVFIVSVNVNKPIAWFGLR